jgi:TRAP-type mannitol/chloroaromatic compound transport system permease large subunit
MKAGNLLGGLAVAVLLSAPFIVPSVGGIATWKIIMGVAGLSLFVRAGMSR